MCIRDRDTVVPIKESRNALKSHKCDFFYMIFLSDKFVVSEKTAFTLKKVVLSKLSKNKNYIKIIYVRINTGNNKSKLNAIHT